MVRVFKQNPIWKKKKNAVMQPYFAVALITLAEHSVLMMSGTAECWMGPQPNDIPHLDCSEEITTSISWYIHRRHRPSLVSA